MDLYKNLILQSSEYLVPLENKVTILRVTPADFSFQTLLLGLRYEEFSWDYARPSKEDDPNCLSCLFLQFVVTENGTRVSKILQVFSRQASLMDTLISTFVRQSKEKSHDEADRLYQNHANGEGGRFCIMK